MSVFVSRSENLGFVYHIHSNLLQNARLYGVPNPTFCHHGDRYGFENFIDDIEACSPGYSSRLPHVIRELVEYHHGDSSCILSYVSLLEICDIHYDSMFLHVSKSTFQKCRTEYLLVSFSITPSSSLLHISLAGERYHSALHLRAPHK